MPSIEFMFPQRFGWERLDSDEEEDEEENFNSKNSKEINEE